MKIGFFGTPELAAAVLADGIAAEDVEVVYVVSQPDRPVGRHATLTPSPVSQLALRHNITLFRPEKIRGNPDFLVKLQDFEVDFLVVVAYGKILPAEILALPKVLPINVHASLLPKYRGASPIQWALLEWERETGITIMEMTEWMDEGGILDTAIISIVDEETSDSLFTKFCKISGAILFQTLRKYLAKEIGIREQDHALATYTKKLTREDGQIFWTTTTASQIHRLWQAYTSWPGAWTMYQGKRCKILDCRIWDVVGWEKDHLPGSFWREEEHLLVATREWVIELGEIVIEGKGKRRAVEILNIWSFES